MNFWRGKIGLISPAGDFNNYVEHAPLLPEGVIMTVTTLGVKRLVPQDAEKVFILYPAAAKHLASQECDVIIAAGSLVFSYIGSKRTEKMFRQMRATIAIPIISDLDAHFDAFRALSAKKIVMATPYTEARNEERKQLLHAVGFEVLAMKALGIENRVELGKLPPYASYRLAKQAFLEAPEADAIYISCPEWPTVRNIQKLEDDTGKPVVCHVNAVVWSALKAIHVTEPIKGYGRLMELL